MGRLYRLGCVPYINAYPIIKWFEALGPESPVELDLEVPSKLPELLEAGKVDAIMTSSYEALTKPNKKFADQISISCIGPVASVKLFSNVPAQQIQTLALDQSSLTSNCLAQIILKESYGVRPRAEQRYPDINKMLRDFDGCVIIGDNCMNVQEKGLYEYDLGEEWYKLTRLPFVWALWIGSERLDPELVSLLIRAKRWGFENLDDLVQTADLKTGWGMDRCKKYFTEFINYDFTNAHFEGLMKFREYMEKLSLIERSYIPERIELSYTVSS